MSKLNAAADAMRKFLTSTSKSLPYANLLSQNALVYSITAALGICTLGYSIWSLEWHLDPTFRAIPKIPTLKYLLRIIRKTPLNERNIPSTSSGFVRVYLPFRGYTLDAIAPEAARQILYDIDAFPKAVSIANASKNRNPMFRLFQGSLLNSTAQEWKHIRQVVNPAFHRQWDTADFGLCTIQMIDVIAANPKSVDTHSVLQRLTLDVLGRAVLGFNFGSLEDENSKYVQTYNKVYEGMFNLYMFLRVLDGITPARRRYRKHVDDMIDLLDGIVAEKSATFTTLTDSEKSKADLLTLMLQNSDAENGLTKQQLRSNLFVFFLAGHDTTSSTLTSELFFLALNPKLQERARREVIDIMGDGADTIVPTLAQTKELVYLNSVIREAMRLIPPAASTSARCTTAPQTINGIVIPAGCYVSVNIYRVMHDKALWGDNIDEFDPERFLGSSPEVKERLKYNIVFGDGARACIGMGMSLVEQRVALMMLLRKYTFTVSVDSVCQHDNIVINTGILRLNGCKLDFTSRF